MSVYEKLRTNPSSNPTLTLPWYQLDVVCFKDGSDTDPEFIAKFTFKKGDLFSWLKTWSSDCILSVVCTRERKFNDVHSFLIFGLCYDFVEISYGFLALPTWGPAGVQRCSQGNTRRADGERTAGFVFKAESLDIKISRFQGKVDLHVRWRAVDWDVVY